MTDAVWVSPGYPWTDEPATNIFYRTQARALDRLGASLTVVCPTPWAPWPLPSLKPRWRSYAARPRSEFDGAIPIRRPRYLNVPGEPLWARPERLIAGAAWGIRGDWQGAAVVHGHAAVTGIAASRLARKANLPWILTFHGSDMNVWPDAHPERADEFRDAVQGAQTVIGVSAALVQRIREVTGAPAVHLPIGVDHDWLASVSLSKEDSRRALGLPRDRLIALFVGNLKPTKGVAEFVDAIVAVGKPYLGVLVGGGTEAGYGLTKPGASMLLDYRGACSHEDVVRYMSAADVLVLPSHSEGLPTVLVEAGSVGLPVIATPVGGVPELLGLDRGIVLPEVSSESVRAALVDFRGARDAADAAAERLRQHVHEQYDVDRNAKRLLGFYRAGTSHI